MRTFLLFSVAIGISVSVAAQKSPIRVKADLPTANAGTEKYDDAFLSKTPSTVNFVQPATRGTNEITVIPLGNSANAYGLYNGGRTALYADPNTNAITFTHRMLATPGSGYVAYDASLDGGATWSVNNQVFDPTAGGTANARYPQGVIYNPQGNTDPANAYYTAFFPTLDGSNAGAGSWGGYGVATEKLDGTGLAQNGWPSDPPIRQNVPDAMAINPVTGDIFVVEPSLIDGLGNQYTDTLVITRGTFNSTTGVYNYEATAIYFDAINSADVSSIADCKIAFAPDGQIGYILMLTDNEGDPFITGMSYYPVLLKTTDGGLTWGDPIVVPLGGPDGLDGIVNGLLTDDQIAELFVEPLPSREEIPYTTAFTSDLAVDDDGDPVISVVIGVTGSDAYSIVSASGFTASYNIFGTGQGEDFWAQKLGENLKTFRGTWGDVSEDNRSQITSSWDGTKMFFSWLDTDFEGVEDNNQPDIFCIGWDVTNNMYTEVMNVTYLSEAWLQAFMGTASTYALPTETGDYEVPFVYQAMDPVDPAAPVQYMYIKDFVITADMYTIVNTNNNSIAGVSVSQNFPNPFKSTTDVLVNLEKQSNVSLEVYNMVGQKVFQIPVTSLSQGSHKLTIDAKNLKSGIYTYSVVVNNDRLTRKMIVE